MAMEFTSSQFSIDEEEAKKFACLYDSIPIHIEEFPNNPFIKVRCVSGILVQGLINRILVSQHSYEKLICATGINIDFHKPVFTSTQMYLKVRYSQQLNSRKNAFRRVSECHLISAVDKLLLVTYKVNHLIKV